MSKYTPGPWVAYQGADGGLMCVASPSGSVIRADIDGDHLVVKDADLGLICAAPALFRELRHGAPADRPHPEEYDSLADTLADLAADLEAHHLGLSSQWGGWLAEKGASIRAATAMAVGEGEVNP